MGVCTNNNNTTNRMLPQLVQPEQTSRTGADLMGPAPGSEGRRCFANFRKSSPHAEEPGSEAAFRQFLVANAPSNAPALQILTESRPKTDANVGEESAAGSANTTHNIGKAYTRSASGRLEASKHLHHRSSLRSGGGTGSGTYRRKKLIHLTIGVTGEAGE